MTGELSGVSLKLQRARHHFSDLEYAVAAFHESHPYRVGVKRDTATRKPIYFVESVEPTPSYLALIASDIFHNLRSSLDHLAAQLVIAGTGNPKVGRSTQFPIFDDHAKFVKQSTGRIAGMTASAINAITSLEPWKGGKGHHLWELHELNIIDKHRLLLTVGSAYKSVDLGPTLWRDFNEWFEEHGGVPKNLPGLTIRPADALCPLKSGDELFIDAPDAPFHNNMKVDFHVAIYEPDVLRPEWVVSTALRFTRAVEGAVVQLRPYL
jgi:hypothetical protein